MSESTTGPGGIDPFVTSDAAYVLGALSPEDRAAFEGHLRTCEHCARSVRELAGLPGLLAQVDVPHQLEPDAVPPGLLPTLAARVRRGRRRALAIVATGVAVAACLVLALVLLLPGEADVPGTAMTPLGRFPVQANVALANASWGTQVDMSCSYRGGEGGDYVLVAVRENGEEQRLATWYAVPDDTATMSVGTRLHTDQIKALEIRLPDGRVLLRLPVSG